MPELWCGRYKCQRCREWYIVNDGTWRRCTPEFCHGCTEWLDDQFALIPVDREGKDVLQ